MTASRKVQSGLAGAIAMAAGSQAYGVVSIPTPADIPTPPTGTTSAAVGWNVDGVGGNDFVFQFRHPNATGTGVRWQANMNPQSGSSTGNAVAGFLGPFINYATNFAQNTFIGATLPSGSSFRTATQVTLGSVYSSGGVASAYGGFGNGAPSGGATPNGIQQAEGYVGFRVGTGANARYGWLQLRTNTTFGIDFIAAALGDVGETVETGIVPEPASLGLLAIGATALLRRNKK
jgi:hypothetical protein